jgi:hypothetical protein
MDLKWKLFYFSFNVMIEVTVNVIIICYNNIVK